MAEFTIGQLARKAGVGVETIRFYERERLLTKPARSRSGYRRFGQDAVAGLAFIRRAKNLGFSLAEIRELLALRADPSKDCSAVDRRVQAKISQIEEKVRELQRMKRALRKLSAACINGTTVRDCVILDSLSGDGNL
ncbi:MAG: heavy metal-responsive transcriptional regulator [Deltaproteobacteria bacterium]|nr:heavy metal-responsive transcriptional regulator [Deltaproteobacteria bacterium]